MFCHYSGTDWDHFKFVLLYKGHEPLNSESLAFGSDFSRMLGFVVCLADKVCKLYKFKPKELAV